MSTVFHLVRHAAHDQLGKTLTGRSPGARLSDRGREEARALARRLASEHLDALCASPQPRTRETAKFIAEERGIVPEICEELDEIDFGRWSGQPFEALAADADWQAWNDERATAKTPGGESMRDVAERVAALVDRLRAGLPGGAVGLVSHCDVIKAAVCHYLGLPFDRMHRFEIDPASLTTLVVGNWGSKLLRLNETVPVPPDGGGRP